jgi:hypothetical protein
MSKFVVVAIYLDEEPSVFGPFDTHDLASEWLDKNKHGFSPEIEVEVAPLFPTDDLDPVEEIL